MNKALPIANAIALATTIVINYLSNTGVFDGHTMATISASYPTLFTPAGYAFGIWIVIYLGLIGFIVYQGRSLFGNIEAAATIQQIGWWFVLSCIANGAWVLAWLYEWTGVSLVIMLLLLYSLWQIVLRTDMELTDPPPRTILGVWWPFCIYFGWLTAAIMANLSVWLLKIGWPPYLQHPEAWTIGMIIVAAIAYLLLTWRRNMREAASVGAWALIAIGIADHSHTIADHPHSGNVTITAYIVAALLLINTSIHAYKNRKFAPFRRRSISPPPSSI